MEEEKALTTSDQCTLQENGLKQITAPFSSFIDEKSCKLKLEFTLPGVKKDDIHLRLMDDSFRLTAQRDDFEYMNSGGFCCPIDAKDASASYDNGLLRVEIPFKDPFTDAIEVTIH